MGLQLALFDYVDHKAQFLDSPLGQIYQAIPFEALTRQFVNAKTPKGKGGRRPHFTLKGGLALMFLKHYSGLSDSKLIDRIRTDWTFQMFCDIAPTTHYAIKDEDVVGRWRGFFGHRLDLDVFQKELAQEWKPHMENTTIGLMDATVYESDVKYPTSVKLLSDCIDWLKETIEELCKDKRIRQPRSKYNEIMLRVLHYSKLKKKTYKKTRKLIGSLLYLCEKLFTQLKDLGYAEWLDLESEHMINIVDTVLSQQKALFLDSKADIKGRILSWAKPYLRPIVRGKENKPVEFGMKTHLHQVGGCNFIEHMSFEAFHEGNRLPDTVLFHNKLFGKLTALGADRIYATNANRRFCTGNKIATNFAPKGFEGEMKEQKSQMRKALGKARATRLEGSFGNEKNHYLLRRVRARSEETERAWIIFGIHTANAVKMAKLISAKKAEIVNQAA